MSINLANGAVRLQPSRRRCSPTADVAAIELWVMLTFRIKTLGKSTSAVLDSWCNDYNAVVKNWSHSPYGIMNGQIEQWPYGYVLQQEFVKKTFRPRYFCQIMDSWHPKMQNLFHLEIFVNSYLTMHVQFYTTTSQYKTREISLKNYFAKSTILTSLSKTLLYRIFWSR